jgi:phosphatidylglycerophosphate synthase
MLAAALDLLDGALARATARATRFGSVFDAVMDRVSEAAVLFGLLYYFSDRGGRDEELLIFAAVVASFLVSYTRARAEIVDVPMR